MKKYKTQILATTASILFWMLCYSCTAQAQIFTFSKMVIQTPTLGIQSVDIAGEVTITDSTITQTLMGMTAITPVIKINNVEYKIKIGDIDIRYKFAPIPQFAKDDMKDKKGKWLVKEMEFATHVLIIDAVDRFTNEHTFTSMYLTPKLFFNFFIL